MDSYPLLRQIPHLWRMPICLAHNKQQCVPHSQMRYGQSSQNKAGPIKPVLDEPTNQVQQKGETPAEQIYVLRDK